MREYRHIKNAFINTNQLLHSTSCANKTKNLRKISCLQTAKRGPTCRSAVATVMTHSPVCDCRAG